MNPINGELLQFACPCDNCRIIDLLDAIVRAHGCSPKMAGIPAVNCAAAERDSSKGHGIIRTPGYVSAFGSGWVDGRAEAVMHDVPQGSMCINACNGAV